MHRRPAPVEYSQAIRRLLDEGDRERHLIRVFPVGDLDRVYDGQDDPHQGNDPNEQETNEDQGQNSEDRPGRKQVDSPGNLGIDNVLAHLVHQGVVLLPDQPADERSNDVQSRNGSGEQGKQRRNSRNERKIVTVGLR